MLRNLWRWRVFVYAFGGILVGYFMMAIGHPVAAATAPAPLVDVGSLDQSFKLGASGANLPNADLLSPMVNSLNGIQGQIAGYAEHLFVLLVSLDVFWMVAQFLLTRDNLGEFIAQLATKVFTVVFVYYVLIQHGGELVTTIIGSFSYAASNANISGQYNTSATPTALLAAGATFAAIPVAEAVGLDLIPDEGLGTGATNLSKAASEMLTGAAFAIFGAFSGLAAEIAIATLEVYVVLNLGIIVTGFLGSRWTERFGQGFLSFAISAGVKFMFVQIILGLMYPYLLETAATEAIPVVGPAIYAAIAIMVVAILHAVPSFAASALSGQSNSSGAQLGGAMSQVFGGLAGAGKALGGLPKQNAASRAAKEEAQFKSDQMRDFYDQKGMSSPGQANRPMQMDGASRPSASLESSTPAAGGASVANGATGGNGVAGGNGVSTSNGAVLGGTGASNGGTNGAPPPTMFSGANGSPASGAALGGASGSNGWISASPAVPSSKPSAPTTIGASADGGKPLDGTAAPSGQPSANALNSLDVQAPAPTVFSAGTSQGALPAGSATGPAVGGPQAKLPAAPAAKAKAPSVVGGLNGLGAAGKPLTSTEPSQLKKGLEEAKKLAEKAPETTIGISAESLHAKSRDDSAALPPPNQAKPPAPSAVPAKPLTPQQPGVAGAVPPARPSVAAITQKPAPEPDQGKPLQ